MNRLGTASTLAWTAICLFPVPALADLDPAGVANMLRAGLQSEGYILKATPHTDPSGALDWTDVSITGHGHTLSTPSLRFAPLPDGEVGIHWKGGLGLDNSDMRVMTLNGEGDIVTSDQVPGLVKSFTFPELLGETRTLADAPMTLALAFHLRNLSGTTRRTEGSDGFEATARIDQMEIDEVAKQTEADQSTHAHVTAENLDIKVAGTGLALFDQTDWRAALKQGAALTATLTQGASTSESEMRQPNLPPFKSVTTTDNATTKIDFSKSGVHLASEIGQVSVTTDGGQIPWPLRLNGSGFMMTADAPVELPGTAAFKLGIPKLELDAPTWSLIDPTGALRHDPLRFDVNLTGALSKSLATGPDVPEHMNIDDLGVDIGLSVLGAEVTATGTAKAASSLETMTGTANIGLVGLNGLADQLVQAGLFPRDQLMPLLAMLAGFSQPGKSEDDRHVAISFRDKMLSINGVEVHMPGTEPAPGAE